MIILHFQSFLWYVHFCIILIFFICFHSLSDIHAWDSKHCWWRRKKSLFDDNLDNCVSTMESSDYKQNYKVTVKVYM